MFHNKLCVIKYYYNFLDLHMCYSDKTFDFEILLIVLNLLASFHFKSLACYMVINLQCIRQANFNSFTFSYIYIYIFQVLIFQLLFYFYSRLIEMSRDVEKNRGPNSKSNQSFSICDWYLNSITAHKFSKTQSLIGYNCSHHFDIVCLSEKYLNSDIWIYQFPL